MQHETVQHISQGRVPVQHMQQYKQSSFGDPNSVRHTRLGCGEEGKLSLVGSTSVEGRWNEDGYEEVVGREIVGRLRRRRE